MGEACRRERCVFPREGVRRLEREMGGLGEGAERRRQDIAGEGKGAEIFDGGWNAGLEARFSDVGFGWGAVVHGCISFLTASVARLPRWWRVVQQIASTEDSHLS